MTSRGDDGGEIVAIGSAGFVVAARLRFGLPVGGENHVRVHGRTE